MSRHNLNLEKKSTIEQEREFFIDNLLVRILFIIVMSRWTGLAPWEFEFPFPGSLTSTFLVVSLSASHFILLKSIPTEAVHFRT